MLRLQTFAIACAALLLALPAAGADNPTQLVVTASGNTTLLDVPDGNRARIHAMMIIGTDEMTAAVAVYIYNGDHNLIGSSTAKIPIDKSGISGPAGFVLPESKYGWVATDAAGEDIVINMSAAQPVIVLVVFSYF